MMKSNTSGPNRLSRTAAKEVPHRSDERFFSAKADVKKACEDLLHDLRHSAAHEPMVADMVTAVNRVQQQLKDIAPDEPKSSSHVRDIAKEVQHLQLAETWVSSTERVLTRLGSNATQKVRDGLLEAQDTVMWCVRAEHWDGQLTAAVTQLQKLVQEAEAQASRFAE
jgi:septal ring factor EnvC (AmiA/AmiB activator)